MRAFSTSLVLLIAMSPAWASCTRGSGSSTDAGAPVDTDVLAAGTALPLPPLPPTAELVSEWKPGVIGPIVLPHVPSTALRGALQRDADGVHFRSHTAIAATAIGDQSWLLVLARSGIWLLERATLAVRARLETNGEGDIAASPDGSRFAFGRCVEARCTLEIRAFPSLVAEKSIPIDRPHRVRFSPDGLRIAVASTKKNSATLIDLARHEVVVRHVEGSDVNDVVILPVGSLIAYGTNEDETVVHDWMTHKDLWRDRPSVRASGRGFDQNAIAYDARTDALFTGGNDNTVWRVDGIAAGAPKLDLGGAAFANDVVDLAVLPSGRTLVALDSGSLEVVDLRRAPGASPVRLPALGSSVGLISLGARVSTAGDDVVGVLGGVAVRWAPEANVARPEPKRGCLGAGRTTSVPPPRPRATRSDRFSRYDDWTVSEGREDTVFLGTASLSGFTYPVARVPLHPPEPLDVAAQVLGDVAFEMHSPLIAALRDGTRILFGKGKGDAVRVYRIAPGGPIAARVDVDDVRYDFMNNGIHAADGSRLAYVGQGRAVLEVDATSSRHLGNLRADEDLRWDAKRTEWTACSRSCRPLKN